MKLLYLLFAIANATLVSGMTMKDTTKIIKNIDIPACRNCIHYKPFRFNTDFSGSYSECGKFGNKDIITDKISYDFANSCRRDESLCGNDGIYFEREPNINMKILKHKIISNIPNGIIALLIILFGVAVVYK